MPAPVSCARAGWAPLYLKESPPGRCRTAVGGRAAQTGAGRGEEASAIADLTAARRGILDQVASLPREKQDADFLGTRAIKDRPAPPAGRHDTNCAAIAEIGAYQVPGFYVHAGKGWRTYSAGLVQRYRRDTRADLLAVVADPQRRLLIVL